jgi:hypothetical protein
MEIEERLRNMVRTVLKNTLKGLIGVISKLC